MTFSSLQNLIHTILQKKDDIFGGTLTYSVNEIVLNFFVM